MAKGKFRGGMPVKYEQPAETSAKMQQQAQQAQQELEQSEFVVSSGGGMVEVVINGKKEVTSLKLIRKLWTKRMWRCWKTCCLLHWSAAVAEVE